MVPIGDDLCMPCTVVARLEADRAAAPQREAERIVAENAAADAAAAASTSPWETPALTPRLRAAAPPPEPTQPEPIPVVVVEEPPQEEGPLFDTAVSDPPRRIYVTPSMARPAAPPPQAPQAPVAEEKPMARSKAFTADKAIPADCLIRLAGLRRRIDGAPLNDAAKKVYSDELRLDVLAAARDIIDGRSVLQSAFSRAINLSQPIVSNWRRAEREGLEYRNPPRRGPDDPPVRVPRSDSLAAKVAAAALPPVRTLLDRKAAVAAANAQPAPQEPIMPRTPDAPTQPTKPATRRQSPPNGKPAPSGDTLHKAVRGLLDLHAMEAMDAETVVATLRGLMERLGE
jgi:hypothetical protein